MALALEAELDDDPAGALNLLRRWLGRTGTLDLLRALSDLCRNPECARLARALYVLLASSEDDGKTRMLRMLGILDGVPERTPAEELRTLVASCLEVVEADSVSALWYFCSF